MKLSVVVICWNSLARLQRLFPTLLSAIEGIDAEIIVVDNGSTDGTGEYLKTRYGGVRYRLLDRNRGVAYARNRGMELAQGEYIWLLDDDTEVNTEAIRTMLAHMDANPGCGICACRLTDADGELQESFKTYPSVAVKICNVLGFHCESPYVNLYNRGEVFHPDYVIGACQLIRSKLLKTVGMLDEAIFYGPEDADFCLRMTKAGYRVDYLPTVGITHHWRRRTTSSPLSALGRAHVRGLLHFWHRHRRWF